MLKVVDSFSVKNGFVTLELNKKREIDPKDTGIVKIGLERMNYIWEHNPYWISLKTDQDPSSFIGKEIEFEEN